MGPQRESLPVLKLQLHLVVQLQHEMEKGGSSAPPEVCGQRVPFTGPLAGAVSHAGAVQGHYNGTAHLWRGAGCI